MTQSTRRPIRRKSPMVASLVLGLIFTVLSALLIAWGARGSNEGFGSQPYELPAPYNINAPGYVIQEPFVAPTTGGPHPPTPTTAPRVTPTAQK